MKDVFNLIVSFWDTTEYAIANFAIMALIAPIAYVAAYKITGKSAIVVGYNSKAMRRIHWGIRFLIHVGLTYLLKGIIWILSQPLIFFNVSDPKFSAAIIALVVLFISAIYIKIKSNLRNKIFWL